MRFLEIKFSGLKHPPILFFQKAGAKVLLFSDIHKFFGIFFAFLCKKVQN